jgi:hypothetical protein
MPAEMFSCRVWNQYAWQVVSTQFYFWAENTISQHPYQLAEEMTFVLYDTTPWLFWYAAMLTDRAAIQRVTMRRCHPAGGPTYSKNFEPGTMPGGWPFEMTDNFQAARCRWFPMLGTNRHWSSRIGPIGAGATGDGDYSPTFKSVAYAFMLEHLQPRTTASGVAFRSCGSSANVPVEYLGNAQLTWPPARQKNRRLTF